MSAKCSSEQPIGVFDSGVGGLTVLKALQHYLPHEQFVYYADTLHMPYGNKSEDEIFEYTMQAIDWLVQNMHVKMVVIACHTSSAILIKKRKVFFQVPVINIIEPAIKRIAFQQHLQHVGIIATQASINSKVHEKELRQKGFLGLITNVACPELALLIEQQCNNHASFQLKSLINDYMGQFTQKIDLLLYGCTHYPFVMPLMKEVFKYPLFHLDPADAIARAVRLCLSERHLLCITNYSKQTFFFVTQDPVIFQKKIFYLLNELVRVTIID